MLPLKRTVEEHVAPTSRTGDLAPERALLDRGLVRGVDEVVGDLRRQPLLLLPRRAQQFAELRQTALEERVLHRQREILAGSQSCQCPLIPARPVLGLVLDDL